MSDPAFRFDAVTKRYGAVEALNGFSLEVPKGAVVGFVGRNGAGKSTSIRCLMGLQKVDGGRVEILGLDPWTMGPEAKRRLGYLSERGVPFSWASASDLSALCAPMYPHWDTALEADLLGRFGIDPSRALKTLSMGQQRAVGLMLALCPRPEVLVLDEPAANLDPFLRREFLEQILGLVRQAGRTIFFSSHILADVERIADRIVVIHRGRKVLEEGVEAFRSAPGSLERRFMGLVGA